MIADRLPNPPVLPAVCAEEATHEGRGLGRREHREGDEGPPRAVAARGGAGRVRARAAPRGADRGAGRARLAGRDAPRAVERVPRDPAAGDEGGHPEAPRGSGGLAAPARPPTKATVGK